MTMKVTETQSTESGVPPLRKPEGDAARPPAFQGTDSQKPVAKKNKSMIILFAAIGLLAVGCVLVYLFVLRDSDAENDEETEETTESSKEAPVETALPEEVPIYAPEQPAAVDYSYVCTRWLDDSDLADMTSEELRRMRNTVFARHGRRFQSPELREYFSAFSWYEPRYDDIPMSELSDIERHNISLIQSHE